MAETLVLLPGWALGPAALAPLADALRAAAPSLVVQVVALPDGPAPQAWLDRLDAVVPAGAWLAGWSLGGMLALHLAARRGADCPGMIGIASAPCFRARADWPAAMPAATFDAFRSACQEDAPATLRRFVSLVAQGAADPRGISRRLQAERPDLPMAVLNAGLALLADLDGREALQRYPGPRLHLFAEDDALVPAAAAEALAGLPGGGTVRCVPGVGHAWPLECPTEVADSLLAFLDEAGKGDRPHA
ncbi:alpha/beta fold hydrolase [Pseudomonas mangiferae]|uniref:Alpha/beta fold hydrolase n=1 Tax=Pseudomonas mangiferae TaxID=2593654 RepID=A0A553H028_9PSED|nr:alpha/beta fold hydrolase [Pseudomonas mangiferae]TRX75114.1 alpha/beta fold hydrolase [Pseudomonas mangiferae]